MRRVCQKTFVNILMASSVEEASSLYSLLNVREGFCKGIDNYVVDFVDKYVYFAQFCIILSCLVFIDWLLRCDGRGDKTGISHTCSSSNHK